jgi:hypothetical protein
MPFYHFMRHSPPEDEETGQVKPYSQEGLLVGLLQTGFGFKAGKASAKCMRWKGLCLCDVLIVG